MYRIPAVQVSRHIGHTLARGLLVGFFPTVCGVKPTKIPSVPKKLIALLRSENVRREEEIGNVARDGSQS
jgi:hypothetical protein